MIMWSQLNDFPDTLELAAACIQVHHLRDCFLHPAAAAAAATGSAIIPPPSSDERPVEHASPSVDPLNLAFF